MAGETEFAAQIRQRERAKLSHLDNNDGNKPYRSGDVAITNAAGGAILPLDWSLGAPPQAAPPPVRLAHLDDRSTDKYYRAQPVRTVPLERLPGSLRRFTQAATVNQYHIAETTDVNPVVASACNVAAQGTPVTLTVASQPGLMMRARTALDLAVTRETLTAEQARLVRLLEVAPAPARRASLAEAVARITGPPPVDLLPPAQPLEEEPLDLDDFLVAPAEEPSEDEEADDGVQVLGVAEAGDVETQAAAEPIHQQERRGRKRR